MGQGSSVQALLVMLCHEDFEKFMKRKPSYSRKKKVPKDYHSESEMERNKEP